MASFYNKRSKKYRQFNYSAIQPFEPSTKQENQQKKAATFETAFLENYLFLVGE
jgi:hypothetical protein